MPKSKKQNSENGAAASQSGHGFGTAPVFLAAICTILGAIMFLRFGYAVGSTGLLGALMIVAISHLITIPTALAVSEIATNQKVEGGGEYYIISRSFGTSIGGTIGVSLYLSQAISIAFYMIAFAEAFRPIFDFVNQAGVLPFALTDARIVSLPGTLILAWIIIKRGANVGVKLLWGVAAILVLSLSSFFLGSGTGNATGSLLDVAPGADSFNRVFAICFPAFTGMTAGVGLSGDLKDPRKSIPLGTLSATLVGMVVYVFIIVKFWLSASPAELAGDSFIMGKISFWEPLIPLGLGAATISSAVGSMIIAPRTLQALAGDSIFPSERANRFFAEGRGQVNEPINASIFSGALAVVFVLLGDVDMVAQIISMFFMVTYGALCGISFLEHFAANPSYRPTFRTRWYVSLTGMLLCLLMMFQMSVIYAGISILIMYGIYLALRSSRSRDRDLSAILQGVMFQMTRHLHVSVQKQYASFQAKDWRPSLVMISQDTFERNEAFDILRWISYRYGFGTLIHHIEGLLSEETTREARRTLTKLIQMTEGSTAAVFVDTVVSPDYGTALTQMAQTAGISGLENNCVFFEYPMENKKRHDLTVGFCALASPLGLNQLVLRSSGHRFGFRRSIHVWLTEADDVNANLLILMAFIISGHPDWDNAEISVFASFPARDIEAQKSNIMERITAGRLPISRKRVRFYPFTDEDALENQIVRYSGTADLTLLGFRHKDISERTTELFTSPADLHDTLFISAAREISIH